jgi:hypothetical protein
VIPAGVPITVSDAHWIRTDSSPSTESELLSAIPFDSFVGFGDADSTERASAEVLLGRRWVRIGSGIRIGGKLEGFSPSTETIFQPELCTLRVPYGTGFMHWAQVNGVEGGVNGGGEVLSLA